MKHSTRVFDSGRHDTPIPFPERLDPKQKLEIGDLYLRRITVNEKSPNSCIQLWIYDRDSESRNDKPRWQVVRNIAQEDTWHPKDKKYTLSFTNSGAPSWVLASTKKRKQNWIHDYKCWVPDALLEDVHLSFCISSYARYSLDFFLHIGRAKLSWSCRFKFFYVEDNASSAINYPRPCLHNGSRRHI